MYQKPVTSFQSIYTYSLSPGEGSSLEVHTQFNDMYVYIEL